MRIPLMTKSNAAASKKPASGMTPRNTPEMSKLMAAAVTVPRLLTIRGIMGIATRAENSAIAIQIPAVVSLMPKRRLYHVGTSCTITPRPKPENTKTIDRFSIRLPEMIGRLENGFRDFVLRAVVLKFCASARSAFLSLMKSTGIVDTATNSDITK